MDFSSLGKGLLCLLVLLPAAKLAPTTETALIDSEDDLQAIDDVIFLSGKSTMEEISKRFYKLENECRALRKANNALNNELIEIQDRLKDVENGTLGLDSEVKEVKKRSCDQAILVERVGAETVKLRKSHETTEGVISEMEDHAERLSSNVSVISNSIKELSSEGEKLGVNLNKVSSSVDALSGEAEKLRGRVDSAEDGLNTLGKKGSTIVVIQADLKNLTKQLGDDPDGIKPFTLEEIPANLQPTKCHRGDDDYLAGEVFSICTVDNNQVAAEESCMCSNRGNLFCHSFRCEKKTCESSGMASFEESDEDRCCPTHVCPEDTSVKEVLETEAYNIGCFDRDGFSFQKEATSDAMTAERCIDYCLSQGWRMAGVQKSYCFCGDISGSQLANNRPADECNGQCTGPSGRPCGGESLVSLYGTKEVFCLTQPCPMVNACENQEDPFERDIDECCLEYTCPEPLTKTTLIGCYTGGVKENSASRQAISRNGMTPERCAGHCLKENNEYSMLTDGDKCYCGSVQDFEGLEASAKCELKCSGNEEMDCGGSLGEGIVSVYSTEEELCRKANCQMYAVCEIKRGKAMCDCDLPCTLDYAPVCGSDGKTYANACALRARSCRDKSEVTMTYNGPCNLCDTIKCGFYSTCEITGSSSRPRPTCVCPTCEDDSIAPVCGTDGVTYRNECELQKLACQNEAPTKIRFSYPCGPIDCQDVLNQNQMKSGVYTILPIGYPQPFQAYCEMDEDGKTAWTVIQRRGTGDQDFNQNWEKYKDGFGLTTGDYWLGNEKIYRLSNQLQYRLQVEMEDWEGGKVHGDYDSFNIDDEESDYVLHLGQYEGNSGDSLSYHDQTAFSTKDVDNDGYSNFNCAEAFLGGWWYKACFLTNANGKYYNQSNYTAEYRNGIEDYHYKGLWYSLKSYKMKITRV